MAKKNGIVGDLLDALGDSGGEIISDLVEEITGAKISSSEGDDLLEGLLEGGGNLLEGLGDVVSDLTGLGAANTEASDVASMTGEVKSSAAKKKKVRSSTGKKTTSAKKTTKTTSTSKTSSAAKKTRSSAAKKKSV